MYFSVRESMQSMHTYRTWTNKEEYALSQNTTVMFLNFFSDHSVCKNIFTDKKHNLMKEWVFEEVNNLLLTKKENKLVKKYISYSKNFYIDDFFT